MTVTAPPARAGEDQAVIAAVPVAADLRRAVAAAASGRCVCSGQCGSKHLSGGGRCPNEDSPAAPLHAIARDPAVTGPEALAADALMAVCAACQGPIASAREAAARRAAAGALGRKQATLW